MDFSVFDTFLDSVILLDSERRVIFCNEAAQTLTGVRRRKMSNQPITTIFTKLSDTVLGLPGSITSVASPQPFEEVEFETQQGIRGKAQVTLQPAIGFSEAPLWILYLRDVTLEEALHSKYHKQLSEKEVVIEELQQARAKLEEYSRDLEKMVAQRTQELRAANRVLDSMVNCLGQGFLLFGQDGLCHPVYSKACEVLFESVPAGRPIWEVLKLEGSLQEDFRNWYPNLFSEILPFKELAPFGPRHFKGTKGRHIWVDYHPMRDESGVVIGVVAVATDRTEEVLANQSAEREKAYANMVVKLVRNKGQFLSFVQEARQMVADLKDEMEKWDHEAPNIEYLFRVMHTMKGCAAVYSISSLQELAHEYESQLSLLREGTDPEAHSRVVPELKRNILQLESALQQFLSENQALIGQSAVRGERCLEFPLSELKKFAGELRKHNTQLAKTFSDNFLKEPIGEFFSHFDEVVAPLALRFGKKVAPIEVVGGDIRILPDQFSELFATLVHAFRNAIDHGIEVPEKRHESGKNPVGRIRVQVQRLTKDSRPVLQFEIEDDGKGIDPALLRKKVGTRTQGLSDQEVLQFVFHSGVTTRDEVNDISGRGVGMDAIRDAVRKLGGSTEIYSQVLKGTRLVIQIPEIDERVQVAAA